MAIEPQPAAISYAGNNSTVIPYPVPFRFDDPTWLAVYHVTHGLEATQLTLGVDFTVVGQTVVTVQPVPFLDYLRIERNTPMKQAVQSSPPVQSYPSSLERQLDQTTMQVQDASRRVDDFSKTALRFPHGNVVNGVTELPAADVRAGGTLGFDAFGQPIIVATGLITDVAAIAAAVDASAGFAVSASGSAGAAAVSVGNASASASAAAASAAQASRNNMGRGIFADATSALAAGLELGSIYYTSDYTARAVGFPIGSPDDGVGVALMGDSITAATSDTLAFLVSGGYPAQARVLLGSRVDFIPNGSQFSFATSGYTSAQIIATHLPNVLTSGARMCWFMAGTNDGGVTPSQYAANMTTICTALRNKGIYAVMVAPPAIPLAFGGNATGAVSAAIAAKWATLPAVAAATGAIYVPCPAGMQTTPGSAIALDDYIQSDHLHPNAAGAAIIGRALADAIRPLFNFSLNPYGMGGSIQTLNPSLAGSAGNPSNWSFTLGAGATATKSLVDLGGGVNAWRFTINTIGATQISYFAYTDANVSDLTGKTIDGVVKCSVLSGSFARIDATVAALTPFIQIARDLFDNSSPGGGVTRYQAGDELILRTPKGVCPRLSATMLVEFDGSGVLQYSLPQIRSYP